MINSMVIIMRIEVGQKYQVTSGIDKGSVIEVTDKYEVCGRMRYIYEVMPGGCDNEYWFDTFSSSDADSIFAECLSLSPCDQFKQDTQMEFEVGARYKVIDGVDTLISLYKQKRLRCYISSDACYKIDDTDQKAIPWSNQSELYESEGALNMKTDVMKWMEQAIQTIQSGIADKLTKDNITIYRVKDIIRIDIKGEVQIVK